VEIDANLLVMIGYKMTTLSKQMEKMTLEQETELRRHTAYLYSFLSELKKFQGVVDLSISKVGNKV
jgi:hypothetical protein